MEISSFKWISAQSHSYHAARRHRQHLSAVHTLHCYIVASTDLPLSDFFGPAFLSLGIQVFGFLLCFLSARFCIHLVLQYIVCLLLARLFNNVPFLVLLMQGRRWETGGPGKPSGLACDIVPSGSCPLWKPRLFWPVGSVTFWVSTYFPFGLNLSKRVSFAHYPQHIDPGTHTCSGRHCLWPLPSSSAFPVGCAFHGAPSERQIASRQV